LALGCDSDITTPSVSSKPTPIVSLALGSQFSCALTLDAKPYCWGDNLLGQLGDSSFASKLVPTRVALSVDRTFIAISGGVSTACALEKTGVVWCWGDDPTQPGVRLSLRNQPVAIQVGRPFVSIAAGRKSACGLDSDGVAYCWGENGRGQLGVGDTLPRAAATRVAGDVKFTAMSAGFWSTCGLSTGGKIYCWGDNTYGELGTGDTQLSSTPKPIAGSQTFRFVMLGSIHACGITTAGATMCWGANYAGQLGDGTSAQRLTPTASAPGLTFTSLRAGRANSILTHTCGVTASGDVYCWGWNSKGQLSTDAVNTRDDCLTVNPASTTVPKSECSYKPVKASGISQVVSLDAGSEHTCALTASAALLCWGDNTSGQLGDGTGVGSLTPVPVKGGLRFP
jgi:alpha-tubulin suppressor-like RCC1 family protein